MVSSFSNSYLLASRERTSGQLAVPITCCVPARPKCPFSICVRCLITWMRRATGGSLLQTAV